jgi:hypothetical protein
MEKENEGEVAEKDGEEGCFLFSPAWGVIFLSELGAGRDLVIRLIELIRHVLPPVSHTWRLLPLPRRLHDVAVQVAFESKF